MVNSKKLTPTESEGLGDAVEAVCGLPSTDRLSALAKRQRMTELAGYLAGRMSWMSDTNLAETAFPEKQVVDEINSHVEKALREIKEAWRIQQPHEPKMPTAAQPKPPPLLG